MQITHKLPHDTQIRAERKNEKRGEKNKTKTGRDSMTSDVSNLENESPPVYGGV